MSNENRRGDVGIAMVVGVLVVLGVLLLAPFGGGSSLNEAARLSNADVTIEAVFSGEGTNGTFTASGVAICDAGEVTRKGSGTTATGSWYEDEYRCSDGAGSFILRGELPPDLGTAGESESLQGTWLITSGRDDYGHLKGDGASDVAFGPPRIDVYTGTATNGG